MRANPRKILGRISRDGLAVLFLFDNRDDDANSINKYKTEHLQEMIFQTILRSAAKQLSEALSVTQMSTLLKGVDLDINKKNNNPRSKPVLKKRLLENLIRYGMPEFFDEHADVEWLQEICEGYGISSDSEDKTVLIDLLVSELETIGLEAYLDSLSENVLLEVCTEMGLLNEDERATRLACIEAILTNKPVQKTTKRVAKKANKENESSNKGKTSSRRTTSSRRQTKKDDKEVKEEKDVEDDKKKKKKGKTTSTKQKKVKKEQKDSEEEDKESQSEKTAAKGQKKKKEHQEAAAKNKTNTKSKKQSAKATIETKIKEEIKHEEEEEADEQKEEIPAPQQKRKGTKKKPIPVDSESEHDEEEEVAESPKKIKEEVKEEAQSEDEQEVKKEPKKHTTPTEEKIDYSDRSTWEAAMDSLDLENLDQYPPELLEQYCKEEGLAPVGESSNKWIDAILKYNNESSDSEL